MEFLRDKQHKPSVFYIQLAQRRLSLIVSKIQLTQHMIGVMCRVIFLDFFLYILLILTKWWTVSPGSRPVPLNVSTDKLAAHKCQSAWTLQVSHNIFSSSCDDNIKAFWLHGSWQLYPDFIFKTVPDNNDMCYSEISSVIHSSRGTILLWGSTQCHTSACNCWPTPALQ